LLYNPYGKVNEKAAYFYGKVNEARKYAAYFEDYIFPTNISLVMNQLYGKIIYGR